MTTFKDTDLREALRRKYANTPTLPADFMEKMMLRISNNLLLPPFDPRPHAADGRSFHVKGSGDGFVVVVQVVLHDEEDALALLQLAVHLLESLRPPRHFVRINYYS